jgi:hypothetical protein
VVSVKSNYMTAARNKKETSRNDSASPGANPTASEFTTTAPAFVAGWRVFEVDLNSIKRAMLLVAL